jgi:predicted phage-related endonuclease
MTATVIPIVDEQQWLAERARDVTSTEVPALYGLSPYLTAFELWHQKRGRFVEARSPDNRIRWGNRLQDAIAAGVAEDRGWKAKRLNVYMRVAGLRLGSSFDFEIEDPKRGRGLMEIKNVDALVFRDEWLDTEAGIEGPQHIELQVQNEMEVAEAGWCALVALVGGNDAKVTIRERDRAIGQSIRQHVGDFWQSIEDGAAPRPDYKLDAEFLCRLHGRANAGEVIDADPGVQDLLARYVRLGTLAMDREMLKAQVLERIGTASKVRTPFGTLVCCEVAATRGAEITADMVGQRTGARAGYRMFRFTESQRTNQ